MIWEMEAQLLSTFRPSPLTEFPLSLQRYFAPEFLKKKQRELYERAIEDLEKHGRVSDDLLQVILWYPKVLEAVMLHPKLSSKQLSDIAWDASLPAFNVLVADYNSPVAQTIEMSLLPKAEYVCRLLLWAHEGKITLRYPLNFYYPILYVDFYWAHYFFQRRPLENFFEHMVRYQLSYQDISPSALLCLACLGHFKGFDEAQIDIIAQDPSVAFQTAVLFRDRIQVDRVLRDAYIHPQWAFHILTTIPNLPADAVSACMVALEFSPPWMLEFLVRSNLVQTDLPKAKALMNQALEADHPLAADMAAGLNILKE